MKVVLEVAKPRNHFVVLAHKRKAGSHTKTGKAIRRKENMKVKTDSNSIGRMLDSYSRGCQFKSDLSDHT